MEAHNGVGEVGVETHTRSKGNGHICKKTHAEAGEGGDSGGSRDKISSDLIDAEHVVGIGDAQIGTVRWTHTGATRVGDDGGIDGDDVCHGEEGCQTGADLCEEV